MAASKEINCAVHGRISPNNVITTSLPSTTPVGTVLYKRTARRVRRICGKHQNNDDEDEPSSTSSYPTLPSFNYGHRKDSPKWQQQYQRHIKSAGESYNELTVEEAFEAVNDTIETAISNFHRENEEWNQRHDIDQYITSTLDNPTRHIFDQESIRFWHEMSILNNSITRVQNAFDNDDDVPYIPPQFPSNDEILVEINALNLAANAHNNSQQVPPPTTTCNHSPTIDQNESSSEIHFTSHDDDDTHFSNTDYLSDDEEYKIIDEKMSSFIMQAREYETLDGDFITINECTGETIRSNVSISIPPTNQPTNPLRNGCARQPDESSSSIANMLQIYPTTSPNNINEPQSTPKTSNHIIEDRSKIYTQNVQGLFRLPRDRFGKLIPNASRDTTKMEMLIDNMRREDIDAMLLQETWLEDDVTDLEIGGYHVFRHNSGKGSDGSGHLFRGVAIILSPRYYTAWKAAGSPAPITTDPNSEFVGRFISLSIQFKCYKSNGRPIKNKFTKLTLTSVYHPCDDDKHDKFNSVLDSLLSETPKDSEIILGADINARIGIRDRVEYNSILGPHGFERRNTRGTNLLSIYMSHRLKVENTFFLHDEYTTYVSKGDDKTPSMHDIFSVSQSLHKRVRDCKVVRDGVESDHSAVCLEISLSSIKFKEGKALSTGIIDWPKILADDASRATYAQHLKDLTTTDMCYEDFNEKILQAGELTATKLKKQVEGWFQFKRDKLAPIIEERDTLIHRIRQETCENVINQLSAELVQKKNQVQEAISIAKADYYADLCTKIHDMSMNPKLAWEYIRILTGGEEAHYRKSDNMAMKMDDGSLAKDAKDNMSVMYPHFQKVFNNHRPVDIRELEKVKQRMILWEIGDPITWAEFDRAINKLKNGKASGLNDIPPEAYKAMDYECRSRVFRYVNDFFEGTADYEGWHRSQCVPVPKSGDLSNPNKWRGVMLMDVCSKIFSIIMNERAFKLLEKHGTPFQFGGTPELGCQDGLFTIKTLLNMRKNHNLPSYVAFVDLVKAYDTANHELLLQILKKYGAPPKFVSAIERMYTDLVVVLKIEKEVEEILQEVGVRQGDNMAPVLFLFLMSAFAETLEIEWKQKGIEVVTVKTASDEDLLAGRAALKSHTTAQYTSRSLSAFEILQCLYVDDGAFVFSTREDMIEGLEMIFHHFAKFGLEMHIGRGNTTSKTECVFFPPPGFFTKLADTPTLGDATEELEYLGSGEESYALSESERKKYESEKARIAREDVIYDGLSETENINVDDGYVSFTKHFKYLGSYISYNLRDDFDIESRIASASASMGALSNFWNNSHVDLYSKYLLFRAIPMNLLLWGCETWSLRQVLLNKVEVFLHRSIRRILRITITQVQEKRIRNEHVRGMFYDIPSVRNMIAARQLNFIGKVIRGPSHRPAQKMITACCDNTRLPGRPHFHNKDLLVKNLKLLFSQVHDVIIDDKGTLKNWINEVMCEPYWNQLVQCLIDKNAELPERPATWTRRRRSPRNHDSGNERAFPPTPPRRSSSSSNPSSSSNSTGQNSPPSPPPRSPPRRSRVPPPRRNSSEIPDRDWIPANVGRILYDSFKVLGLSIGASERELKIAYRKLSRKYHPDSHNPAETGLSHEEAVQMFQHINNANSYLREIV